MGCTILSTRILTPLRMFAASCIACVVLLAPSAHAATGNVLDVRVGVHADKTRLVIDLAGTVDYKLVPSSDGRTLLISLDDSDWQASRQEQAFTSGLVRSWASLPDVRGKSSLLLETSSSAQVMAAFALSASQPGEAPYRIVIDLIKATDEAAALAAGDETTREMLKPASGLDDARAAAAAFDAFTGMDDVNDSSPFPLQLASTEVVDLFKPDDIPRRGAPVQAQPDEETDEDGTGRRKPTAPNLQPAPPAMKVPVVTPTPVAPTHLSPRPMAKPAAKPVQARPVLKKMIPDAQTPRTKVLRTKVPRTKVPRTKVPRTKVPVRAIARPKAKPPTKSRVQSTGKARSKPARNTLTQVAEAVSPSACEQLRQRISPDAGRDPQTLYLWGACWQERGNPKMATLYYQDVLSLDPKAHRARLELADMRFAQRQYAQSREEFGKVIDSKPPKKVVQNIVSRVAQLNRFEKGIDDPQKWNFQFQGGVLKDSNVNSGPASSTVTLYGLDFTLDNDSQQSSTTGLFASVNARGVYEVNPDLSFEFNGGISRTEYANFEELEASIFSVRVGPLYRAGDWLFGLPLTLQSVWIGGDGYSSAVKVEPNLTYPLTKNQILLASAHLSQTDYRAGKTKDAMAWGSKLGLRYILTDNWFTQLTYGYVDNKANTGTETYASHDLTFVLGAKFANRLSVTGTGSIFMSDYDKINTAYGFVRNDNRTTVALGLNYDLRDYFKGMSIAFNHAHTNARSSVSVNAYERNLSTLSLTKRF